MNRRSFGLFLAFLFISASSAPWAHATTYISGAITSDTVWKEINSPYVVSGVSIASRTTLTIEPGVIVKMNGGSFDVKGTLIANGTPDKKIYFTSIADDSVGGDTNGDGPTRVPAPSDWLHIVFNAGSRGELAGAVVRYGGDYHSYQYSFAGIYNLGGDVSITGSEFYKNAAYGIRQVSGTTTINFSDFHDQHIAIMQNGGTLEISNSNLHNNTGNAFESNDGNLTVTNNNFYNNGWSAGMINGKVHFTNSQNIASGNRINAFDIYNRIDHDQLLSADLPYIGLSVKAGAKVTLEPGVVVKTNQIIVEGELVAQGTANNKIYFTSLRDDSAGGDTNGDGSASSPIPGDWVRVNFLPGSVGNFSNAVIRYAGGFWSWTQTGAAVFNEGGTVSITDSKILNTFRNGIIQYSGSINITRSEIAHSGIEGIINFRGALSISQSSIHDNPDYGLHNYSATPVDARFNWWGDASGPRHPTLNPSGNVRSSVSNNVDFEPWLGEDPLAVPTPPPPPKFEECCSSVLFLPGAEASRLYRPGEDQVWEPTRNQDVEELYLLPSGESKNTDIYTRDIIDEAPRVINGFNVYKKFINFMNDEMVDGGIINEWEAIPYDWRLDFEKILASGKKIGETGGQNNISYLEATTTPYIFQELTRLAKNSDTGKVTIITHSNGGLLAKYLLSQLEDANHPYHELLAKIDKVIMVAAPQVGTPGAVEGLLHGDEQQLGAAVGVTDWGLMVDEERARELAENMQSAYNLLPSEKYFDLVQSPIIEFKPSTARAYDFPGIYGSTIDSIDELNNFLLGDPQAITHRSEPASTDEESPNVVKAHLLSRAVTVHDIIDQWTPPATMELVQIAGWGIKTLRGIEYSCKHLLTCFSLSTLDRDILKTHVGDGTVVLPSAVAVGTAENVEKFYVNIRNYNFEGFIGERRRNRDHASILEIDPLRTFIKNLVQDDKTLTTHITSDVPALVNNMISLDYTIHTPVDIHIYDSEGNHTGLIPNPIADSDLKAYEAQLPNSYYWEYGEVKYAGSEASTTATTTVKLIGTDFGTFTFNINETRGDDIIATSTFQDIPVALGSVLTMEIKTLANPVSLQMDVDANGTVDAVIKPGDGLSADELIGFLRGFIGTLHLPEKKQAQLLKRIDKLEKAVEKEYKNEKKKKQKTNQVINNLKQLIAKFVKKSLLTNDEASELLDIIGKIQGVVVE